ncbi:MAG: NUDIX hydrolase [Lachnospiraceae bacterium]|nr:NUDIX hydrolase [Lachnospiraceae bacterium]
MRFFEDISRFYGTGERNKEGQTLEEFLDCYDAKQFDCPSNTTDIIVVRCQEELKNWGQELEVLLIKRGNHPGIGLWATPGGFVDMRENLYEGACRELEEETGVKGLPLMQLATWGDYDRDPRWRVITTSFLALVEGNIPVKAGDDAADALWFKIHLEPESSSHEEISGENQNIEANIAEHKKQPNTQIWNLRLSNEAQKVNVGAKVSVTHSGHRILDEKHYQLLESDGLAADHGCLITQAVLYIKEKLER